MKVIALNIIVLTLSSIGLFAQQVDRYIKEKYVSKTINALASDEMRGRSAEMPNDIDNAATFIEKQFKKARLQPLNGLRGFRQEFQIDGFNSEGTRKANIAGMIIGKSKPDELVIFSAHYDHIGILQPINGDSIANGADDDASGTTAVIALARYFSKLNSNERTLVFVAFTAEEIGGYGSKYFSQQLDPDKIIAMFNIEMIGKPSMWGQNAAFITGFERSDFGEILQENLEGTSFQIHPDPYPEEDLFYRSDNATLARLGVPAHSISTDQIPTDPYYHTVNDEVETLDMANLTGAIRAIALSARSIVEGLDTPTRINKTEVK